jgi:hypothetical protein
LQPDPQPFQTSTRSSVHQLDELGRPIVERVRKVEATKPSAYVGELAVLQAACSRKQRPLASPVRFPARTDVVQPAGHTHGCSQAAVKHNAWWLRRASKLLSKILRKSRHLELNVVVVELKLSERSACVQYAST